MLESVSPITAFLPCPTVNGPVGFADTNSTFALLPLYFNDLPKPTLLEIIFLAIPATYCGEKKKFINPGPAISALSITFLSKDPANRVRRTG